MIPIFIGASLEGGSGGYFFFFFFFFFTHLPFFSFCPFLQLFFGGVVVPVGPGLAGGVRPGVVTPAPSQTPPGPATNASKSPQPAPCAGGSWVQFAAIAPVA